LREVEIVGEVRTPRIVRFASTIGQVVGGIPLVLCLIGGRLLAKDWPIGMLVGVSVFLVWRRLVVERLILRNERQAEVDVQRRRFSDALQGFALSEAFFARHRWLDRYRWLLLGCATRFPHEAIALGNRASCLIALDRQAEAARLFAPLPEDHPACEMLRQLASRTGAA
jgi:hypothetical protein